MRTVHNAFAKVVFAFLTVLLLLFGCFFSARAEPMENEPPIALSAPSLLLMDVDSGAVIFEKNADEKRPVASVTKLMTALLVLEKVESGAVGWQNQVTVSPNAAGTTGSQALLDAHAQYDLETLFQATVMASGNDSAVALAEYLAGTEEAFARQMNARAAELGLQATHYVNCTGLPAQGQYTCARDVARLCREIAKYPAYFQAASVWMDDLVHPSGRKTALTNTNRLVRFYKDCDGFKTGSTNEAKYCVCATAKRDGMRLAAIVLGASSSQTRFDEARAMLDYGFAAYRRVTLCQAGDQLDYTVPVTLGARDQVGVAVGGTVSMLMKTGQEKAVSMEVTLPQSVGAPVKKGDEIGEIRLLLEGKVIASLPAVAAEDVRMPGVLEVLFRILESWK